MFRLTACQLCLLNRSSTRQLSLTKGKWRKPLPAAKLVEIPESLDPSVVLAPVTIVKDPKIGTLTVEGTTTATNLLNPKSPAIVTIPQGLPVPASRFAFTPSEFFKFKSKPLKKRDLKEEEEDPLAGPPLKLVNAIDPTILDKASFEAHKLDLGKLPSYYLGLSKFRLTGLVVVTAMAGYALAPATFAVLPFASLTLGTALTSASANTINQIMEVEFDSQMDRTKNRVLVRNLLSVQHAKLFAAATGISGVTLLAIGANPLTAALGGLNLMLYTCMYTPMKRTTIANTWAGSVVGGIPPIMGWVACTGELSHGALLLGGLLYAWQFPHFNALSWNLRKDYGKAGYKMMAVSHPDLLKRTSLRYSISMIAMSSLAPVCNVTSWTFVLDSLPLNGYLVYLAYRFYKDGDSASSRKLFRFTLVHLPILIMLMMISKANYPEAKCESGSTVDALSLASTVAIEDLPPTPAVPLSITTETGSF